MNTARRVLPLMLSVLASLVGCGEDGVELLVDLRTDFVPGIEFTGARVEIYDGDTEGSTTPRSRTDTIAFWPDDYVEGVRVAEVAGLEPSEYTVVASLLDGGGTPVAVRRVRVTLSAARAVTVVATRDCASVDCPTGAEPTLTACVGGRCVDPRCTPDPESAAFCPPALCSDGADCEVVADCAVGLCIGGSCLVGSTPGACADDEFCHPETSCEPLSTPPPPPPPPPSGCASVCEGCEPCADGADGVFAPSVDTMLPGGTYRYESFTVPEGVTVDVTGTEPLIVLSRTPVMIAGTLMLRGPSGENGRCGLAGPVAVGGVAVAGGGDGGDGGDCCPAEVAASGAGPGGGGGGRGNSPGSGGGGGGHTEPGRAGGPDCEGTSAGAAGLAYDAFADAASPLGGSGGGGAGAGVGDNGEGGAGGAGGGVLKIVAPMISVSGTIDAAGGAGGDMPNCDGGSGGGGSGGTIWLRADAVAIDGQIDVRGGRGGSVTRSSDCRVPRRGGDGADGVVRLDAVDLMLSTPLPLVLGGAPCDEPMCI